MLYLLNEHHMKIKFNLIRTFELSSMSSYMYYSDDNP